METSTQRNRLKYPWNHEATDWLDKADEQEKDEIKTVKWQFVRQPQEVERIKAPTIVLLGDEGRFLFVEYEPVRLQLSLNFES